MKARLILLMVAVTALANCGPPAPPLPPGSPLPRIGGPPTPPGLPRLPLPF